MRMYILIRDYVEPKFAIVAAAHASLACYFKFQDHPDMITWKSEVFYKVICKVNEKEFENARSIENNIVITESELLGKEVAIAFCPRGIYPKMFNYFRLWNV